MKIAIDLWHTDVELSLLVGLSGCDAGQIRALMGPAFADAPRARQALERIAAKTTHPGLAAALRQRPAVAAPSNVVRLTPRGAPPAAKTASGAARSGGLLLTNTTFEFIEEVDKQADLSSLVGAFQKLIAKFGMACFLAGDMRPSGAAPQDRLLATTWPQAWLEHWWTQGYVHVDPVVRRLLANRQPVRWSRADGMGDATATRIMEEASEFHMNAGFAVPVYSREGSVIAVAMAAEHYELGAADETCLHLASIYFHSKLEALRAKAAPPRRAPRLTPRERESLTWVAAGKTDWEVSQILNIAEQTVHEYIQNALIKLNATTRAQAVAIAIMTKLIAP